MFTDFFFTVAVSHISVFCSVLRFVSSTDNIKSCSFTQMMELRLENTLAEAQDKVENTFGSLTVEVSPQLS